MRIRWTAIALAIFSTLMVSNFADACHKCRQRGGRLCFPCIPWPFCPCPPVAPPVYPAPTYGPVYTAPPQTSYMDVPQIQYRQEPVREMVPVTTYREERVDMGGYQKVWVPNYVTRRVPETTYQQRLSWKTVPYQVTHRVPVPATSQPYYAAPATAQGYPPADSAAPLTELPPMQVPAQRSAERTPIPPPLSQLNDQGRPRITVPSAAAVWQTQRR